MDIYLNDEELKREQNLLSPQMEYYPSLTPQKRQLKDLKLKMSVDNDVRKPPPSC